MGIQNTCRESSKKCIVGYVGAKGAEQADYSAWALRATQTQTVPHEQHRLLYLVHQITRNCEDYTDHFALALREIEAYENRVVAFG